MNNHSRLTSYRRLRKAFTTIAIFLTAAVTAGAASTVSVTGTHPSRGPISVTPPASTGLSEVIVVWNTAGTELHYETSGNASAIQWYRFSNLGGGFAEEIPSVNNGSDSYIRLDESDMGYIIDDNSRRTCLWVVNYANHQCTLGSLDIVPDQTECDRTALSLTGSADKITYYSVNGAQQTLSRDLQLEYHTLVYNADSHVYEQQMAEHTLESVDGLIRTDSPLCSTYFSLSGDRFLHQWGMEQHAVSPSIDPTAIAVTTSAQQAERSNDNEQREDKTESLGGSGPVVILFSAATTDAVVYREWQFARDPEFDIIDMRVQQDDFEQQFSDFGTTYVRFVAGNDSGSCDFTSETYTVYVGESKLDCPNAFSPGATEGTNDEWKVSYKSIVSFDCSIFNRWGQLMIHFTDPSKGWDGRYNGKLVPTGVYYYVISAKGTDGRNYKLSGDINILRYEDRRTSVSQ
ncbi:MAG: gliding motility-associated C-terminal domain-containing protein [Bacteroidales bacterium]|nr:gliding motility-associated C-terminal domain-containing protein [Bacteroidales bacterium]